MRRRWVLSFVAGALIVGAAITLTAGSGSATPSLRLRLGHLFGITAQLETYRLGPSQWIAVGSPSWQIPVVPGTYTEPQVVVGGARAVGGQLSVTFFRNLGDFGAWDGICESSLAILHGPPGRVVAIECHSGGTDQESFVVVIGLVSHIPSFIFGVDCQVTGYHESHGSLYIDSHDLQANAIDSPASPTNPSFRLVWESGAQQLVPAGHSGSLPSYCITRLPGEPEWFH
jgi:hypothetical protein